MREREPVRLRRVLDAALGAAIVVGGSIGIGILSMPGAIAGQLGGPGLILTAWLVGGVLALLGANIYAELATTLPQAGGPYLYVKAAAGPFAGFVTGWADAAVSIVGMAAQAALIGEYLESRLASRNQIAIALVALLGTLNWFGLKVGARAQQALSLLKVGGLIMLALFCLAVGGSVGTNDPSGGGPLMFAAFIGATVLITETYAGWNSSVYFSEEDKDSSQNIPRALFWGIGAMMGAYLLVNAGLLAVLPHERLATSNLPAADASAVVLGENGPALVRAFAVMSLVGILNVSVMYTPRIFFSMGRGGMLPQALARLNRHSTPHIALFACLLPAAALAAGLTFAFLFTVTAFLGLAINTAVFLSFFQLRRRLPDVKRPYRARWHPWAPLAATLFNIGLLLSFLATDPGPGLFGMVAILLSWPIYRSLSGNKQHISHSA